MTECIVCNDVGYWQNCFDQTFTCDCGIEKKRKKTLKYEDYKKLECGVDVEKPTKTKSDGWKTDYYQIPKEAEEIQDLIEYKNMNFAIANIFKAAYRLGSKEGTSEVYDLNKIIFFAERERARLEG